jgi:hypothetical protein
VNEQLITIQKYVLNQINEDKNSKAGTEKLVKDKFPKEIILLKIK